VTNPVMTTTRIIECAEEIHETARELMALGPTISIAHVDRAVAEIRLNLAIMQASCKMLAEAASVRNTNQLQISVNN